MQQKTRQNAKQTVVHTTKDNEDRAQSIYRYNLSIACCET